jgi:hypothetical protein
MSRSTVLFEASIGLQNRWTTYLKSRLNCSVPGDYPFYFDEIQSTTELLPGRFSTDVFEKNIEEENIMVTSS